MELPSGSIYRSLGTETKDNPVNPLMFHTRLPTSALRQATSQPPPAAGGRANRERRCHRKFRRDHYRQDKAAAMPSTRKHASSSVEHLQPGAAYWTPEPLSVKPMKPMPGRHSIARIWESGLKVTALERSPPLTMVATETFSPGGRRWSPTPGDKASGPLCQKAKRTQCRRHLLLTLTIWPSQLTRQDLHGGIVQRLRNRCHF